MFKRKRSAEDFAEEIKAHLELEADELRIEGSQAVRRDADGLRVLVHQHEATTLTRSGVARRAAPGEEVEHHVIRARVDADDPVEYPQRLLGRVIDFLLIRSAHDKFRRWRIPDR